MTDQFPLSDLELDQLDDDELIAYVQRARSLEDLEAARLALRILVYGHMDNVTARVKMKVPEHAVDLVAGDALVAALTAAFDGTSVGEFRSWLNTIVKFKIADFHRKPRPREQPLGPADDESQDVPVEDETAAVETQSVVDQAVAELSALHRRVVDLAVFNDDQPAADQVAETVEAQMGETMTAANVYQITSRFRKRVRELLAASPAPPEPEDAT